MAKATTPIFESYTMDFTAVIHHAQRADGIWFKRIQQKTNYGYGFTAWRRLDYQVTEPGFHKGSFARLPKD